jgi:hypothetical protein
MTMSRADIATQLEERRAFVERERVACEKFNGVGFKSKALKNAMREVKSLERLLAAVDAQIKARDEARGAAK